MTPPTLVQRARQLSPQHWKGQQTVIRRLSRTQRLPEKTMHDALRRASKLYQADSLMHKMVTFRPNNDTPPDLRAEYLRNPHVFGIHKREDILAWSRRASNATLLKMEMYTGISALVLFERERPEATALLQRLAEKHTIVEFDWLRGKLASMPLSQNQFNSLYAFTEIDSVNIWSDHLELLAHFVAQAEYHAPEKINENWLDERLANFGSIQLSRPFESVVMHKAALLSLWRLSVFVDARLQALRVEDVHRAAVVWHQRSPSRQDCLELSTILEKNYAEYPSGYKRLWDNQLPIVLPWLSMMGINPEEGQRAVELYHTLGPSLLTFTTIANAFSNLQLDAIDNVSELLCP